MTAAARRRTGRRLLSMKTPGVTRVKIGGYHRRAGDVHEICRGRT
jgi:hypothetical protein